MKSLLFGLALLTSEPSTAKSVVIYPLGDSITHGAAQDGYRARLARLLHERGIDFRFVGSLTSGTARLPPSERAHDGHGGWVTDQLSAHVETWIGQFNPDVILLMIGANDIEAGTSVESLDAKYHTLLDRIVSKAPAAWVLVSEITVIRDATFDQRAVEFNARLNLEASRRAARGETVVFVPMHDALTTRELRDLDHPTQDGNDKIAERWMERLTPVLAKVGARSGKL